MTFKVIHLTNLRFSKNREEMELVLGERLRLEKERREIYLTERSFYDLPMQQGVKQLYTMHMPDIQSDAKELSELLLALTGSMAAGSMDAGQMLKLATSSEFGSSDILTHLHLWDEYARMSE